MSGKKSESAFYELVGILVESTLSGVVEPHRKHLFAVRTIKCLTDSHFLIKLLNQHTGCVPSDLELLASYRPQRSALHFLFNDAVVASALKEFSESKKEQRIESAKHGQRVKTIIKRWESALQAINDFDNELMEDCGW